MLIVAFQGWSDAADATTDALHHLVHLQQAETLHVIEGEGYVDMQLQRPRLVRENGVRQLELPDTKLFGTVHRPAQDLSDEQITYLNGQPADNLFYLYGFEPSRDWESYAEQIVDITHLWAIDLVVFLGAMYSDTPHSRPLLTSLMSENSQLRESYNAKKSDYEGPCGISAAVEIALETAGIGSLGLWVQVPHYVHSAPSPKATLALLDKLEEMLDVVIPRGELVAQATEWENNINRIAGHDDDMTRYIHNLEEQRDAALAAETEGDALLLQFQRMLENDPRRTGEMLNMWGANPAGGSGSTAHDRGSGGDHENLGGDHENSGGDHENPGKPASDADSDSEAGGA